MFPLYKGSYRFKQNEVLLGFRPNSGDHFISFPIKGPDGDIRQAEYVQVILHPNPIVVGLQDDSDKVYTKPLYAAPIFHYDGKPVYRAEQLKVLKQGAEGQDQTDRMVRRLNDPSLAAEVHRFRTMAQELERLKDAIAEGEDRWGELAGMHCKTIRRLEMADALARIQDQNDGLVNDALRMCNATAGVIVRRARFGLFRSEVVSGLQYSDEQDRGSKALPDIVGISTRDAERMLSVDEERS